MKNVTSTLQLSAELLTDSLHLILYKFPQIRLQTRFSQLLVPEGLTVVQQSFFPSMHLGLVTEKQPGPHVTRQNKCCQSPSRFAHTHTHRLLSGPKFIGYIQMPASNYTSTCSEREREKGRERRGYYGAFDTVAIARPTLSLDPS